MGNPTKLMQDPRQRATRTSEKTRLILRFLRDECWTTTDMAARVLGVQYPAAHRTLQHMQRDHYLKSEDLVLYSRAWEQPTKPNGQGNGAGAAEGKRLTGRRVILWGITAHGLAYAWDLDEEPHERNAFELGRTHPAYVAHHIGVQRLRVTAEACGWRDWRVGKLLMGTGLDKVPDAEAWDPQGEHVAIEFEREIKTAKRYAAIVGAYLVALGAPKRWKRVEYVCPTSDMAARLQRVIYSLQHITYKGDKTRISERHLHGRITFAGMDQWPVEGASGALTPSADEPALTDEQAN
jgi:hypothetical protein